MIKKIDEAVIREIVRKVLDQYAEKEEGIVVGVSNRHLHLTKEDFQILFGAGSQLTKIKDLTQIGEFASKESVAIIGPKGRIENVRVLGPFRENTQVEISKSDAFLLGVKAPVRESGKVEGTPGIVIEGPCGKINKENGLLIAIRHVHMDLEYAERNGIRNGDMICVRAEGERALTFDRVLARVSPKFRLEMHIDTDEANASDLKSGELVQLVK